MAAEMTVFRREGFPAPYALPAGFAAMFAVGTVAAALHGLLPGTGVLIACAVIVSVLATMAEPAAAAPLGVIGWLTVIGFSRPPYADLRPTGPESAAAAAVMAGCVLAGMLAGLGFRQWQARATLEAVERGSESGITVRRQLAGAALAAAGLPLLTVLLSVLRAHLDLSNDLLVYLVAVVAVTVIGGFWPAVFAAVAACLLLNWFFTRPLHTFTIAEPKNLLALVLFVAVAVAVSSVVHLAARRGTEAARNAREAAQAEALAEGNRMRDALLAAVSHDLRTPLASIKASVSSLRQTDVRWSPSDEADLLATIESNADRLDALVGNLLDMSRLRTGSIAPSLRATAVDEVAPLALRGLDGAETLRIVAPDGLPLVMADPGLLERVLANLFSNALRYSPEGRPPELRARESGARVLLEVCDHGPGVPGEEKERLFEPFRRLDERSSVGLGLAVARGFAEAMGAVITPLDTDGGGLTMRVSLPAQVSGGTVGAQSTRGTAVTPGGQP